MPKYRISFDRGLSHTIDAEQYIAIGKYQHVGDRQSIHVAKIYDLDDFGSELCADCRDAMIEALNIIVKSNKIAVIKLVRQVTGWSLRESKDFVEANF